MGFIGIKHGMHGTPEYWAWNNMRMRCSNPNHPQWNAYGGRGIRVCDSWKEFRAFYASMGPRPSEYHSIERIENDGNYEPSNCCWATRIEQAHNNRRNVFLTHNGRTMCMSEWARTIGVERGIIGGRVRAGWSAFDTLTKPIIKKPRKLTTKDK